MSYFINLFFERLEARPRGNNLFLPTTYCLSTVGSLSHDALGQAGRMPSPSEGKDQVGRRFPLYGGKEQVERGSSRKDQIGKTSHEGKAPFTCYVLD